MEAGNCPTLNMNAMENYLLSHSLKLVCLTSGLSQTDLQTLSDLQSYRS